MSMLDSILTADNGAAVKQLGRQFGLGDDQTTAALAALVPALAAGFSRNVHKDGGLTSLAAALAGGRHSQYLDDPSSLERPETTADGNGMLGKFLGGR